MKFVSVVINVSRYYKIKVTAEIDDRRSVHVNDVGFSCYHFGFCESLIVNSDVMYSCWVLHASSANR